MSSILILRRSKLRRFISKHFTSRPVLLIALAALLGLSFAGLQSPVAKAGREVPASEAAVAAEARRYSALAPVDLAVAKLGSNNVPILFPAASTVIGWAYNLEGQIDIPSGLSGVTAIAAGSNHSLALKSDGTVVGWGRNLPNEGSPATPPAGLSDVTAIAAGAWTFHSLALKSDGTVVAWGHNSYGQATPPAGLSGVMAISGGNAHSLALKSDGTVIAWGYNNYDISTPPVGLSNVTAIAAGTYHNLALKSDGTVVAWGYNGDGDEHEGQLNIPAGLSNVTAIAAGYNHSLALKSDGTVVAWGGTNYGQLDIPVGLSGVVAISAGIRFSLALKTDGTVVAWGDNTYYQLNIPPCLNNVTAISAGGQHSLALGSITCDTTPPVITVPADISAPATSAAGASVSYAASAQDDVDGSVTVNCTPPSGSTFALGTTTVQCSAMDNANNTASQSFNVTVSYPWSGFLQPLNADGSSIFKLGSTVSVKFQLTGANIQNATAKLYYAKVSNGVVGTDVEATSTASATTGNLFRYDSTANQYIFNWGTKGLTVGTYQLSIDLGDGVTRTVLVSLK